MKHILLSCVCLVALLSARCAHPAPRPLDLRGYADETGAISVVHGGTSMDPYFAIHALLLAHDNGMQVEPMARRLVEWLLPRQKPDGTFDRYCRTAPLRWETCQQADADDSLLAMWTKLLELMPATLAANPAWQRSHAAATAALDRLYQPSRGVYVVSHLSLHGLFMDNLEVWALRAQSPSAARRADVAQLGKAIHATFWNPVDRHFMVSTQLEHRSEKSAFYPDAVAQIFPLLVGFPHLPQPPGVYYRNWMREHRRAWLAQGATDYPWGLIAVIALQHDDAAGAACWISQSARLRHSARWSVTDETAYQILLSKGLTPGAAPANCGDRGPA
jgi:hypothetical protein